MRLPLRAFDLGTGTRTPFFIPMTDFFGKIGRMVAELLAGVSRLGALGASVCAVFGRIFFDRKAVRVRHVTHQIVLMGVHSTAVICLVGLSVGMVLALQAAYQLRQFGAQLYTGSLVSVSVTRELGPLVAAIVLSGRVGARLAAELGSMKVAEEIDALSTMGLNPVRYLVAPRCLAFLIVLPLLTVIADIMGMAGGFLISVFGLHINPYMYLDKTFEALVLKDIYTGLIKSFLFAGLISLVSCYQGLSVELGAEGVGKATTSAVVISIVLILGVDCLATAVLYYAFPG